MKAQVTMEGIIIIGIILVIFFSVMFVAVLNDKNSKDIQKNIEMRKTCNMFMNEVEAIFLLGNGAESSIYLENSLEVKNRIVHMENVFCKLCCNVTKRSQQNFSLPSGHAVIRNIEGDVIVS